MFRKRCAVRFCKTIQRIPRPARQWPRPFSRKLSRSAHVMGPTLTALMFAGASTAVAHAQGTMDFSGADTLMNTFKAVAAFIRGADEGTLSRLLVEAAILLAASRTNAAIVLRDAATVYKVDTEAITLKVKQEFVAKEKAQATKKAAAKSKPAKKQKAA